MRVTFKKISTYGDTWMGSVNGAPVFMIKRTYSYGKTGGFLYSLYRIGSDEILDSSCFLKDVTRRNRVVEDLTT
jgi:hypothetical protein